MIEVRMNPPNKKGEETLDEIVGENCSVHIEQISKRCWFVSVRDGEREIGAWLGKDGWYEDRSDVPAVRTPPTE